MTTPAFRTHFRAITRDVAVDVDEYGNDVYDEVARDVAGIFTPGGSAEVATATGDTVTTQPTAYLPADVDLEAIDALEVNGVRYEVDGDPQVWPANPFTGRRVPLPVVVALRKVTG